MKKSILIAGALLALCASVASAAGINLSWDDCGLAGTQNKTFTCNTNAGAPFTAIGSFDPPPGINQLTTITAQIDITTELALPEWWKHGSAFCRGTTGLAIAFDFTAGPFTCIDLYSGGMSGTFDYNVGFNTPNRARLRLLGSAALEAAAQVTPGNEYYAFKMNMLRSKTTGTGNCAGCNVSACIVLNELRLVEPEGVGADPTISNPRERNWVTWQSPVTGPPGCPLTTPTQSKTWGQVKSLYR